MKLFAKFFVPIAAVAFLGSACGKKSAGADAVTTAEADTVKAAEPDAGPLDTAEATPDAAPAQADGAAVSPDVAPAAGDAAALAGDAGATAPIDYVRVVLDHHDTTKPPVTADFKTFKIVEANIDLTRPETAKAVIEVDTSSLSTGIADRDAHAKSPDFLDVAAFAKLTITVDRTKAVADLADTYDAVALLDMHGMKKEVPVRFKVVEKKADGSIVIEGEVKDLARADWGMVAPPEKVNVGPTFTAQVRLTLMNVTPPPPGADVK